MNISEQSFLYQIWKISGFIFGLWLYDFLILQQMTLRLLLSMTLTLNKELEYKDHQMYFKILREKN